MIEIKDKSLCCGCNACASVCPVKCIKLKEDEEGFLYPVVDEKKCIKCGLCNQICPVLNQKRPETGVSKGYAAYNKDNNIRMKSSSGGIFSLIAEEIISEGGVVYGAGFNEKFEVVHMGVSNISDLDKLRTSKYVQSRVEDCFVEAKSNLDSGKKVLFTGTPCQLAGLMSFLRKPYENLYTQDIICHGVPSPKLWQKYIGYREKLAGDSVSDISFRDKSKGWKQYSMRFKFKNATEYCVAHSKDPMMKMFLKQHMMRPICFKCPFRVKHRPTDITLADFWGIGTMYPKFNNNKGTSLVIVHSKKGDELFNKIKDKIVYREANLKRAIKRNVSMISSSKLPKQQKFFAQSINDSF